MRFIVLTDKETRNEVMISVSNIAGFEDNIVFGQFPCDRILFVEESRKEIITKLKNFSIDL